MLPIVHEIPDDIDIPPRLIRRGNLDNIKRRAAGIRLLWTGKRNPFVKSSGTDGVKYYSVNEWGSIIGKMASMHCTHICGMCKSGKLSKKPKMRSRYSYRIGSL